MKKLILLFVLLIAGVSFAQKDDETDPKKIETFEDAKAGISFKYKPYYTKLFLDKKNMDGNITKDFAIVKRRNSFNQVRFHIITLKTNETFELAMNKYRDAIVRERINVRDKSRGTINRDLTEEETQKFGCEKGKLLGYTYADKFREVNSIHLYYMLKGSQIYVMESYLEKRTERLDIDILKDIINSFKIIGQ